MRKQMLLLQSVHLPPSVSLGIPEMPPHTQMSTSPTVLGDGHGPLHRVPMARVRRRDHRWGPPHAFRYRESHNLLNKEEYSRLFHNQPQNTIYILSTQGWPTKMTNFTIFKNPPQKAVRRSTEDRGFWSPRAWIQSPAEPLYWHFTLGQAT